jgi:exodeoxyribonuclease VII large subunit
MMELIRQRQQKLDDLTHRLELAERNLLQQMHRRWETVSAAVRHYDLHLVLSGMRKQLESGTAALAAIIRNVLLQYRVRSERLQTALESLSPLAILERGYAIVFDSEGKLLKDPRAVNVGEEISARLARGEIHAAVTKKEG